MWQVWGKCASVSTVVQNIWVSDMWGDFSVRLPSVFPHFPSYSKIFFSCCPPPIIIFSKQSLPSFMWTSDKRGGGSTLSIQTARLGLSRDLIFYPHTSHPPPARLSIDRYSYLVLLWVPIIQSKHRTWSVCLFIADDICSRLWRAMVQTFNRY